MTEFDFDTVVDRTRTASHKWDKYRDRDVIPLWVADMDFRSAPPIIVRPPAPPAIASRPPAQAVVAKPPAGTRMPRLSS